MLHTPPFAVLETATLTERIEPLLGLVGVVWLLLGVMLAFRPRYTDTVPKRYGASFCAIGGLLTVLAVAAFRDPNAWGFVLGAVGAVLLALLAVVGYRWIVREYYPDHNHADIVEG